MKLVTPTTARTTPGTMHSRPGKRLALSNRAHTGIAATPRARVARPTRGSNLMARTDPIRRPSGARNLARNRTARINATSGANWTAAWRIAAAGETSTGTSVGGG